MCGICGVTRGPGDDDGPQLLAIAARMAATLDHRGPDDVGGWSDGAAGVALAHRRLSIVDLSALGHQPMVSEGGRYVITLNGEIYNYRELRAELAGRHRFRGTSDTEVLLAAIEEWGIVGAITRARGMFAIAVWDAELRRLHLVRDRLGEKPLYYGWSGGAFVFASELKAIRAHPRFEGSIDRDALALYFRFNYVPAPRSIYAGILKLTPGTIVTIDPSRPGHTPDPEPFWSHLDVLWAGRQQPLTDERQAADELERTLRAAIADQMVADVPLGALLSGGVDSSIVVALMQAQSERPVKTFTIGFREGAFDEAKEAEAVARHLGTEHTSLYVTPAEAMAVIPSLANFYDEPYADSSQIPTYLVSRMARRHVTVALSGDGGDELFGGYNRYFVAPRIWHRFGWMPLKMRGGIGASLHRVPSRRWRRTADLLGFALPRSLSGDRLGEKVRKAASVLASDNPDAVYRALVSVWDDPADVVLAAESPRTLLESPPAWPPGVSFEERMMYFDAMTYLPDDILTKVDRAAMAVSLETRVPFLDPRVVELAARVPLSMKLRGGRGKHLVREVLYRYVPRALIDRPKMGFAVPIGEWLKGPLREWAESLLNHEAIRRDGLLDADAIERVWRRHLDGTTDEHYRLWGVLMFQAWRQISPTTRDA